MSFPVSFEKPRKKKLKGRLSGGFLPAEQTVLFIEKLPLAYVPPWHS